ncbi:hypothetical protein TrRE_jg12715 [Triparma retinervis]|uniref:Uncharacterized protein n=1 Tax=Triparma retinervis TaxID=2557542 RepID=A0A9W6ZEM5_9STRA|nr:hypothetical protein TrRE_jg12715 [Triparma retinervis]
MVLTDKTNINEPTSAEAKATPKVTKSMTDVSSDADLLTSVSKKRKIAATLTLDNPASPLHGEEMEGIKYDNGALVYYLVVTAKLMKGDKTRHMALLTPRTKTGQPRNLKLRSREAAFVAGTLICTKCEARPGDPSGNQGQFNVLSFDLDGLTDNHEKEGCGGASRKENSAEREIRSGDAQWLCKFCHSIKSNKHEYLFNE